MRAKRSERTPQTLMMLRLFFCIAALVPVTWAAGMVRPRLLVLTDIGGDPDDEQSMVRLLVHANEFEIEGLIATASGIPGQLLEPVTQPRLIHTLIDGYARVHPNLIRHAEGFPSPERLHALVKTGNPRRGLAAIGAGQDTEASNWILRCLERTDPRPLNVALWGGQTDLAQALWRLQKDRGESVARVMRARLRLYETDDQDGLHTWIRGNFPDLFSIISRAPSGRNKLEAAFRGMYLGGYESLTSRDWVEEQVRGVHGPLGAFYPARAWTSPNKHGALKEGDTPSWFYFLRIGPGDAAHPGWGGWGGRFIADEEGCFRDACDMIDGIATAQATVWRWRDAYQNEFAARMRWGAATDWASANHPPEPRLVGETKVDTPFERIVKAGYFLRLSAEPSSDPDGDSLRPRWWHYREAGDYDGLVLIDRADTLTPTVTVPTDAGGATIHLLLELQDGGSPPFTRYRRVILRVEP